MLDFRLDWILWSGNKIEFVGRYDLSLYIVRGNGSRNVRHLVYCCWGPLLNWLGCSWHGSIASYHSVLRSHGLYHSCLGSESCYTVGNAPSSHCCHRRWYRTILRSLGQQSRLLLLEQRYLIFNRVQFIHLNHLAPFLNFIHINLNLLLPNHRLLYGN